MRYVVKCHGVCDCIFADDVMVQLHECLGSCLVVSRVVVRVTVERGE
jgi:hypothetical protein